MHTVAKLLGVGALLILALILATYAVEAGVFDGRALLAMILSFIAYLIWRSTRKESGR